MALKEDTLITLFIIDSGKSKSDVWGGRRYFVSSEETGGKPVDYVDEKQQVTTFTYSPIPIFFSGIEISGSNRLPRPKLSIANVDGVFSKLARATEDFIGFRLVRIRTYAKFLHKVDGVEQSTSDKSAHFTPESWYFERKLDESKLGITFELASVFDVEGLKLPKRRMYPNFCPFDYRGPNCQYDGLDVPIIENGVQLSHDGCQKTLKACEEHFGIGNTLRFGGFPTAQN